MSLANSKKNSNTPQHNGFEWAGTAARMRRVNGAGRAGRRSALLGMLTAAYANSSRNGRTGDGRAANATDRS